MLGAIWASEVSLGRVCENPTGTYIDTLRGLETMEKYSKSVCSMIQIVASKTHKFTWYLASTRVLKIIAFVAENKHF